MGNVKLFLYTNTKCNLFDTGSQFMLSPGISDPGLETGVHLQHLPFQSPWGELPHQAPHSSDRQQGLERGRDALGHTGRAGGSLEDQLGVTGG